MRIARAIFVKITRVEMCQFTRMPMTLLNVSFMLQNFSQGTSEERFLLNRFFYCYLKWIKSEVYRRHVSLVPFIAFFFSKELVHSKPFIVMGSYEEERKGFPSRFSS